MAAGISPSVWAILQAVFMPQEISQKAVSVVSAVFLAFFFFFFWTMDNTLESQEILKKETCTFRMD